MAWHVLDKSKLVMPAPCVSTGKIIMEGVIAVVSVSWKLPICHNGGSKFHATVTAAGLSNTGLNKEWAVINWYVQRPHNYVQLHIRTKKKTLFHPLRIVVAWITLHQNLGGGGQEDWTAGLPQLMYMHLLACQMRLIVGDSAIWT